MPNWISRLLGGRMNAPTERKSFGGHTLLSLSQLGAASWSNRGFASLVNQGFARNPVVYRCVRLIAETANRVPLVVSDGGRRVDEHPLAALLGRPNGRQSGGELLEAVYAYLQTAGNAYLQAGIVDGEVRGIFGLRPDRMKVVAGADGWPLAYDYSAGGRTQRLRQDEGPVPAVLHMALFHPLDDHYGMAPLEAAQTSLDIHNAAGQWNKALLDNAARPSGALVYSAAGQSLTEEQFGRLKDELEQNFSGAANAGRPMLLEGGLDWKTIALSPRDMDFIEAKHAAARDIALAFGVPPMLLGIPGDNNRPGGVRSASPTAWVPGSRPILFTELGCGAVDKGANQPNVFGDPKSAESGRPYFSAGTPDPLIQRQVLRAHQRWWSDPANNPASMVDVDRMYLWSWDARPYPAFPALTDVWADGPNHRNGHWLTGRLGGMASDELAHAVAADHGVALSADPASPLVGGLVLGTATTAREALEPLLAATGLSLRNGADGLHLGVARRGETVTLDADELAAGEGPTLSRRRGDPAQVPGRLALSYLDRERDYLTGTATALNGGDGPLVGETSAMTLDSSGARLMAERMLDGRSPQRETLDFSLPPSALALEPGDLVEIDGEAEGPFEIAEIRDGPMRRVTARALPSGTARATGIDRALASGTGPAVRSLPHVVAAHLPAQAADPARSRLVVAAYAQPWPGGVQLVDEATGALAVNLPRRGLLGTVATPLLPGPTGVWDNGNVFVVMLLAGHLAAADPLAVLSGSNRLAVETVDGWEVIGFAAAELVSPGRYRLSRLLRGLDGTMAGSAALGRAVMVLDGRVATLPVEAALLGEVRDFRVYGGASDLEGTGLVVDIGVAPALPPPPVHLRARRGGGGGGDIGIAWVRRSRGDGDGWGAADAPLEHAPERYQIAIFSGLTPVRTLESSTPSAVYAAADQAADFGAPPASFAFTVAQVSPVLGTGHAAQGEFHG